MPADYPAEAPLGSGSSSSLQGRVTGVESAQLNAIASLATLFVTPSLRAQFVSPRLHRHDYPWASDMDSTREVAYCKTELLTRRFTGTWRQRSSAGIDVRTRLKLLFPIGFRGEVRDFYTLNTPSFGVPIQRTQQHNVVSGGLVVHY